MPPKPRFTKEEIIDTALEIARREGEEAITARSVAAELGASTRPLFAYFVSMDEIKFSVYEVAVRMLEDELQLGLAEEPAFLGVGMHFIAFARKEPKLYHMLATNPVWGEMIYNHIADRVADKMKGKLSMDSETIICFMLDMWVAVSGLCTAIALGTCKYSDEQLRVHMMRHCTALLLAYKEIPNFATGEFDRQALYLALTGKKLAEPQIN